MEYKDYESSTSTSRISTKAMQHILERLKLQNKRKSTEMNYFRIWRKFNNFFIKLDMKPASWEDRLTLYITYLVKRGLQSSTVKSYISAIKAVLRDDGYEIDNGKLMLGSLIKACRLVNDKVRTRLPIKQKLLEILLFEIQRIYSSKPFLEIVYKTIFSLAYYGLFRIGELTTGTHPVKACDVHVGQNKYKMLFVLRTSKTHGKEARPQKVKITATKSVKSFFCPFTLTRTYMNMRGDYVNNTEPFFIFRNKIPVQPSHVRQVLRKCLQAINLNPKAYSLHSFRIGRTSELVNNFNWTLPRVKSAGRWKSNAVYKYIRDT